MFGARQSFVKQLCATVSNRCGCLLGWQSNVFDANKCKYKAMGRTTSPLLFNYFTGNYLNEIVHLQIFIFPQFRNALCTDTWTICLELVWPKRQLIEWENYLILLPLVSDYKGADCAQYQLSTSNWIGSLFFGYQRAEHCFFFENKWNKSTGFKLLRYGKRSCLANLSQWRKLNILKCNLSLSLSLCLMANGGRGLNFDDDVFFLLTTIIENR